MTNVVQDFNVLYEKIKSDYNLKFVFDCAVQEETQYDLHVIQEQKSYLCCAISTWGCVLHKCVPVVFGTTLDHKFRTCDPFDSLNNMNGLFMLEGRFLSFPNIMMNNNILIHNFYDKLYSKHCKRMFLYGNVDAEKHINRAIQLVYDKQDDILFARDVYASDYVVTENLNSILETYLSNSGKWKPLDFIFEFNKIHKQQLLDHIKIIMRCDINYSIDNLANKILYKHAYLINLLLSTVLQNYRRTIDNDTVSVAPPPKRRKIQTILFNKECKKIVDAIVNGRLIHCVSKTFSKQRKTYPTVQDNCSSNNNIEITLPVLKYRIGNEVARVTHDNMRQKMLKQKKDFVKFIGSFFHGEMTIAGKKFFLCRNARLPDVDYQMVAQKFKKLIKFNKFTTIDDISDLKDQELLVSFNNRPTNLKCSKSNLLDVVYCIKRKMAPIELKIANKMLFINHHEGMVCIQKKLLLANKTTINVLLTPYEYHYKDSIYFNKDYNCKLLEKDDVNSLMSKLEQYYYGKDFVHIFHTIPVPKLIVSLTNLKNAMPVFEYNETEAAVTKLSSGYSVAVHKCAFKNNKMFKLWTLVRDSKLMTAEDPYIPHISLPIRLYNNKINKLKGKLIVLNKNVPIVKFTKSLDGRNCVAVGDGLFLHMSGTLVSNVKINWVYDGKRYKIETCVSGNFHVYKLYVYFRQVPNQIIEKLEAAAFVNGDVVIVKSTVVTSTNDLEGVKICGIHGQKGVFNKSEDLTEWMSEDGTHAQICLSPVSFLSRQSNFNNIERKYVVKGGNFTAPNVKKYPIFNIPYMLFNNTPDNIFKEFIGNNYTGHEKIEGTRFDQWTKNQSFVGNRLSESLQWMRGGSNLPQNCGEFNVMSSLLMCNNVIMKDH